MARREILAGCEARRRAHPRSGLTSFRASGRLSWATEWRRRWERKPRSNDAASQKIRRSCSCSARDSFLGPAISNQNAAAGPLFSKRTSLVGKLNRGGLGKTIYETASDSRAQKPVNPSQPNFILVNLTTFSENAVSHFGPCSRQIKVTSR